MTKGERSSPRGTAAMRSPAEMVAQLRALADHLRKLDSASPEAALMHDAANYIAGATDSLREHMRAIKLARAGLAWADEP
jgi:hypothetical protein